jgi:hypothetical protein
MMNVKVVNSREDFEELMEAYKKRNPVKYELKKEEFAKKLAAFPKKAVATK